MHNKYCIQSQLSDKNVIKCTFYNLMGLCFSPMLELQVRWVIVQGDMFVTDIHVFEWYWKLKSMIDVYMYNLLQLHDHKGIYMYRYMFLKKKNQDAVDSYLIIFSMKNIPTLSNKKPT